MRFALIASLFTVSLSAQPVTERVNRAKELLQSGSQVSQNQAAGMLESAVAACDITADPGCSEAYAWYGMVLQSQIGSDEASLRQRVEPLYAKAIERSLNSPKALYLELEGRMLKVLGDTARSEALLNQALAMRKASVETMNSSNAQGTVFRIGAGISPPQLAQRQEPEYTTPARLLRCQGAVVLTLVVRADGMPQQIRLARSLGFDLDEQAVRAIEQWRFKPATKDGLPVPVVANIEVNFRLL